MIDNWQHGYLYAITPTTDTLSEPPEAYLACETKHGWRFLHAPHLDTNGPHEITTKTIDLALSQGFALTRTDVLSLWEDQNTALIEIARTYGLLPDKKTPTANADQILREITPQGRINTYLQNHDSWPNSNFQLHQNANGTYLSTTIILRTPNPYQARIMLIMLGADRQDIADITGIDA
jgi:hypothetical protein